MKTCFAYLSLFFVPQSGRAPSGPRGVLISFKIGQTSPSVLGTSLLDGYNQQDSLVCFLFAERPGFSFFFFFLGAGILPFLFL